MSRLARTNPSPYGHGWIIVETFVQKAGNSWQNYIFPNLTFFNIHFFSFLVMDVLGSLIIWVAPPAPLGRIRYIDALYIATSALCGCGSISVSMKQLTNFQKICIVILAMFGSQVWTSFVPVLLRRHFFRKVIEEAKKLLMETSSTDDSSLDLHDRDIDDYPKYTDAKNERKNMNKEVQGNDFHFVSSYVEEDENEMDSDDDSDDGKGNLNNDEVENSKHGFGGSSNHLCTIDEDEDDDRLYDKGSRWMDTNKIDVIIENGYKGGEESQVTHTGNVFEIPKDEKDKRNHGRKEGKKNVDVKFDLDDTSNMQDGDADNDDESIRNLYEMKNRAVISNDEKNEFPNDSHKSKTTDANLFKSPNPNPTEIQEVESDSDSSSFFHNDHSKMHVPFSSENVDDANNSSYPNIDLGNENNKHVKTLDSINNENNDENKYQNVESENDSQVMLRRKQLTRKISLEDLKLSVLSKSSAHEDKKSLSRKNSAAGGLKRVHSMTNLLKKVGSVTDILNIARLYKRYKDDPVEFHTREYNAIHILFFLVPAYFFGIQILCAFLMVINFSLSSHQKSILEENGISIWMYSFFQSFCSFNQAGFVLLDDQFSRFQNSYFLLCIVSFLVLMGNTLYPPALRASIQFIHWISNSPDTKRACQYLLKYPRRCFTHLFLPKQNNWILVSVLFFNGVTYLALLAFNLQTPAMNYLSTGVKLFAGFVQTVCTRNAGFTIINITQLKPLMWLVYLAMMYTSVYPLYLSRKKSEVPADPYSEDELGVTDFDSKLTKFFLSSKRGFFPLQAWKLIWNDSIVLFFAVFGVCIIHKHDILTDPNYSVFSIIFEIVSLYGTVGLTLGYQLCKDPSSCSNLPPYSFSGVWKTEAKVIVVLILLLGRHRGIVDNVDTAIKIPSFPYSKWKKYRRNVGEPLAHT